LPGIGKPSDFILVLLNFYFFVFFGKQKDDAFGFLIVALNLLIIGFAIKI